VAHALVRAATALVPSHGIQKTRRSKECERGTQECVRHIIGPPMSAFANLLQDPPPTHAFELSEEGLAFAPVGQPALAEFSHFEPGVLLVSPLHDNIQQPQVLLDHIRSLAPANGHRKRRAAVILPDYCARVAVLDFDTFPSDPEQQQALVRFRLKKSVPFEVDTAVVSYVEQPRVSHEKTGAKVEVLAAVMSSDIVVQYEAPFRAAGFHPGLVTTSSLAALNLMAADGISLLVKLSGRVLSVLVLQENAVNLARCIEMEGGRLEDIESVLHPTIAYVEDELKGRPKQIWLAGFGPDTEQLAPRWEKEWGVAVQAIRSRFGLPGAGNTGLLGYLESLG
jgi:type IV pilus assembly protein PilM